MGSTGTKNFTKIAKIAKIAKKITISVKFVAKRKTVKIIAVCSTLPDISAYTHVSL